ncbi:DMT family transporter [Azospira inquinata]|uniref:DMT family transporter n=1 Tax=Azospira inquinata TaxID=2785627 RepID=A0A975SKI6_9RHOO|nr:DMT family transporter [Azospira inquinata]QWT46891.1 DMT family transporter [Azospira inquinata]QWT47786.1 DMT family transporter [Azospira inquinata]
MFPWHRVGGHGGLYLRLLLTMVLWGGTWIAGRLVVQDTPPLTAAFWRFFIAALALGLQLGLTEGRSAFAPRALSRREWATVFWLGFTGIFAYNLCFLYGLRHISAGKGALVVALNPAAVALVAWLGGGETMNRIKGLGILTALGGCLLVIGNGHPLALLHGAIGLGEWLILGCVLFWTLFTFIGRRATHTLSPLAATFYACALGGLLLGAAALALGLTLVPPDLSLRAWLCVLFLGLFGTALSFTWYAEGIRGLGATRAAAFINLVPIFAVLQGDWLLGERLSAPVLIGGALVLGGVILTNRGARGSRRPQG